MGKPGTTRKMLRYNRVLAVMPTDRIDLIFLPEYLDHCASEISRLVLMSKDILHEQSQGHDHAIDRLEKRGIEQGSCRQ